MERIDRRPIKDNRKKFRTFWNKLIFKFEPRLSDPKSSVRTVLFYLILYMVQSVII